MAATAACLDLSCGCGEQEVVTQRVEAEVVQLLLASEHLVPLSPCDKHRNRRVLTKISIPHLLR